MIDGNKKYFIITYGCQMNVHDSEKLAGMLEDMEYQQATDIEKADIILINTCTIRENAELKVFGKIGALKKLKRNNPDLIIGVGGCMMQSEKAVKELYEKYPQVDLIFGTHNIHHVPELIARIENERDRIVEVWDEEEGLIPDLPSRRENDYKAWVSIIQGCNNFCTYCIVPYVRGRERSRPWQDIVEEVRNLTDQGVKEITLLGQNVNSYGKDLTEKIDFADLLEKLDHNEGLKRIRYMTSHPRDFTGKVIRVIKNAESICEHFHLPVQSGSSRILKRMNRGYSKEEYIELVKMIRREIPQSSITTDFIVGFPGETEEDFFETLDMVEKVRFDSAFTFIYSRRKGTPAAKMDRQIKEDIKKERLNRLMEKQNSISREINNELAGNIVRVLVEGESKNNPEMYHGRDRRNKLIIFPRQKNITGEIIRVKITKAQSFTLFGEVV
ncbi:MAG: tRNA (N6-isopentenyl adenosine(37)-C2)-methylthiotransferase MiaB [Halanaerobiaceae bacterium]